MPRLAMSFQRLLFNGHQALDLLTSCSSSSVSLYEWTILWHFIWKGGKAKIIKTSTADQELLTGLLDWKEKERVLKPNRGEKGGSGNFKFYKIFTCSPKSIREMEGVI